MEEINNKRLSKFLSLVLRHKPETIGLTLDENGWAHTLELIEKMNEHDAGLTPAILDEIVATNSKKRFSFNENKSAIRANQGHSLAVNLELEPNAPPEYLYHGTGEKNRSAILRTGLQKKERQHVHLSSETATAVQVGQRHGKPIVFQVAAAQMQADGFVFYLSENKVWLTKEVPAEYLVLI